MAKPYDVPFRMYPVADTSLLSNVLILLNILGSGEDEDLLFDDDDNHEDLIRLMEHDSDLENDDTGSDSTTSSQGIDRWWKKEVKRKKE